MIIAIRISGQVGMNHTTEETLFRLRLRQKYAAVLLPSTEQNLRLLNTLRDKIAFGELDKETLVELIDKRGFLLDKSKKKDSKAIAESLSKKTAEEAGIKPFFRLHPPRGGIDAKKHFGVSSKAVLGNNKEKINLLVRRML